MLTLTDCASAVRLELHTELSADSKQVDFQPVSAYVCDMSVPRKLFCDITLLAMTEYAFSVFSTVRL